MGPNPWVRALDYVTESCWLLALVAVPIFFDTMTVRIFEPDKIVLFRNIVLVMVLATLVRAILTAPAAMARAPTSTSPLPSTEGGVGDKGPPWWRRQITRRPMLVPVIIFTLVYAAATIHSVLPGISFWGSYDRMQGLYTWLNYIALFLVLAYSVRSWAQIERIVSAFVFASVPVAIYGIMQHLQWDPVQWGADTTVRVASTLGNAIFLGAYLLMCMPFAMYRLWRAAERLRAPDQQTDQGSDRATRDNVSPSRNRQRPRQKDVVEITGLPPIVPVVGYALVLVLDFAALYFTGSRGPYYGFVVAVFLLGIPLTLKWHNPYPAIASIILSVLLFAFPGVISALNPALAALILVASATLAVALVAWAAGGMGIGDILHKTLRLYRENFMLFVATCAVLEVPVQIITYLILRTMPIPPTLVHIPTSAQMDLSSMAASGEASGVAELLVALASVLVPLASVFITAALAVVISNRYLRRRVTVGEAYRATLNRIGSLLLAIIWIAVRLSALVAGIVIVAVGLAAINLAPLAILVSLASVPLFLYLSVSWALIPQVIMLENVSGSSASRRSRELIRRYWWKALGLLVVTWLLVIILTAIPALVIGSLVIGSIVGPDVGSLVISLIIGVLVQPLPIAAMTLLFYDLKRRKEAFDLEAMVQRAGAPSPAMATGRTPPSARREEEGNGPRAGARERAATAPAGPERGGPVFERLSGLRSRSARLAMAGIALVVAIFAFPQAINVLSPATQSVTADAQHLTSFQVTGTAEVRQYIWQGSLPLIAHRAILGWGPETMIYVYSPYYPPGLGHIERSNAAPDRNHDVWLDFLVFSGVLGLLAWLAVLAAFAFVILAVLRRARSRRATLLASVILAVVVGHLVEASVGIPIVSTLMLLWTLFGLATVLYARRELISEDAFVAQPARATREPALAAAAHSSASAPVEAGAVAVAARGRDRSTRDAGTRREGRGNGPRANARARGRVERTPAGPGRGGSVFERLSGLQQTVLLGLIVLTLGVFAGGIWLFATNVQVVRADAAYKQGQAYDGAASACLIRAQNPADPAAAACPLAPQVTPTLVAQVAGQQLLPPALAYYQQAIGEQPNQDMYYLWMGKTYLDQAHYDLMVRQQANAIAAFQSAANALLAARALNPYNADHPMNLARMYAGWARIDPSKWALADHYFGVAIDLARHNGRWADEWGNADMTQATTRPGLTPAQRTALYRQALAAFQHACKVDDLLGDARVYRGDAYEALGMHRQAAASYAEALRVGGFEQFAPQSPTMATSPAVVQRLVSALYGAHEYRGLVQPAVQLLPPSLRTQAPGYLRQSPMTLAYSPTLGLGAPSSPFAQTLKAISSTLRQKGLVS